MLQTVLVHQFVYFQEKNQRKKKNIMKSQPYNFFFEKGVRKELFFREFLHPTNHQILKGKSILVNLLIS